MKKTRKLSDFAFIKDFCWERNGQSFSILLFQYICVRIACHDDMQQKRKAAAFLFCYSGNCGLVFVIRFVVDRSNRDMRERVLALVIFIDFKVEVR